MIGFATATGTRRNLAALRAHGWGVFVTPRNPLPAGFDLYAIDNGAWRAWQRQESWSPDRWVPLIERVGVASSFAIAPDIVCGGADSLALSFHWLDWLLARTPRVLIAVQNGMLPCDLESFVGPRVGIFVGGDSLWKEQSLPMWGALAARTGCYLHVGRVNTERRMRLCAMSGADSFDGTRATRFSKDMPFLDRSRRQGALEIDLCV